MENLPLYPYRSIGSFTNGKAFHIYKIDDRLYLATSTGKSYKVFSLPDLKIKFLSPTFQDDILFIACHNEFTNVLFTHKIIQMKFQHKVKEISFKKKILYFYMLGKYFFISFNDKTVHMYHAGSYELVNKYELNFVCKYIYHPQGYLNKILFCGNQNLSLFNFNSGFQIFDFRNDKNFLKLLQNESINYIIDSPIVDIIAICTNKDKIISLNLKTLQFYFQFHQSDVNCIDFTKHQNKTPYLVSGNSKGQMILWDINNGNIFEQKQLGIPISYLKVLNFEKNEYILMISEQNSIQIYLRDDQEKFQFRLLRQREGVLFPLNKILLYQDLYIIASSQNPKGELMKFSILNDAASQKFSKKIKKKNHRYQTELTKKTNNIKDFRVCQSKTYSLENNNMFTQHQDSQFPLFWDADNVTIRKLFLELMSDYKGRQDDSYLNKMKKYRICTAIEVSNCGNYLFLGYDDGLLIKITTQRGVFISKFEYNSNNKDSIQNIYCDISGNHLVLVKNNSIEKIDFYSGKILNQKNLDGFIYKSFYDKTNNLLSVVYKNNLTKFINTLNYEIIRQIQLDQSEQILDMQIATKALKILISTNNKKLQIWDLFLATKVSEFLLDKNILSLQIQENQNRLFTVIEGEKEIFIWNIRNLNLTINEPIMMKFESEINQLPQNPKKQYLLDFQQQENIDQLNLNDIQIQLENQIMEEFKSNKDTLLKKRQKVCFIQEQKAKQLSMAEDLDEQNAIKDIQEVNQQKDIPFFLDFGDNFLNQLKQKVEGTLESEKKISRRSIREYNKDDILKQRINQLEQKILQIDENLLKDIRNYQKKQRKEENYNQIWQCFKELEYKEIDLYLKNLCLDVQNVNKLLLICLYLSTIRSGINLSICIIRLIFLNIYDKFQQEYKDNIQKVLIQIQNNLNIKTDNIVDNYLNSIAILESLTQRVSY